MNPAGRVRELAAWLFEARGADLLRFLRQRLGSEADARDIAQETYLRLIRLGNPDEIENAEAYLFRIASNLLWECRLSQQKQAGRAPLEDAPVTEHTPFDLAVTQETGDRMRRILDTLPALQRAILILYVRDELSCREVAERTGISASMVKKHLHAALDKCRRRLRDHE